MPFSGVAYLGGYLGIPVCFSVSMDDGMILLYVEALERVLISPAFRGVSLGWVGLHFGQRYIPDRSRQHSPITDTQVWNTRQHEVFLYSAGLVNKSDFVMKALCIVVDCYSYESCLMRVDRDVYWRGSTPSPTAKALHVL